MSSRIRTLGLALAAAGLCAQPAVAAKGDWILRGGVGVVDPKSDNLNTALPAIVTGLPGDTTGEFQVDTGVSATIEATYMFADHWGVELLAAWPFSHDVDIDVAGFDGGEAGPISGFSASAGKVKHLPPTLSLQYHFNPEGQFRPYVGAGVNFTTLFDEKPRGVVSDIGVTKLELDDSWGLAGQVGIDIGITDNWFANFAVRYIDIDSDAKITDSGTPVDLGTIEIGTVEIDPFVYQAQIGYRFGRPRVAPVAAAVPVAAAATAAAAPPPPTPPAPADGDGDGVVDSADQCPATPKGDRVGAQGCSCDVTRQLQFGLNSAELTANDKVVLDEMVENLKRLKFVSGTVIGHTDSSGSDAYNQKLSERRAATVAQYLEERGIAAGRLAVSGAGESSPVADNKSAEGRALNRRVVLQRTDCN